MTETPKAGRLNHILKPTPLVACILDDHRWVSKANSVMKLARQMRKPAFRIVTNLRQRIRLALLAQNGRKADVSIKLLGCTPKQLKLHLETLFTEGMRWENYGEWHIDHKRPCASFDLTDPAQQMQCFHWSNLQPLWSVANFAKGSKWSED